jgi:fatty acyl-CoA reductase
MAHVSTAYANCNRSQVDEQFYDPISDYEDILKLVASTDDQALQDMTKK